MSLAGVTDTSGSHFSTFNTRNNLPQNNSSQASNDQMNLLVISLSAQTLSLCSDLPSLCFSPNDFVSQTSLTTLTEALFTARSNTLVFSLSGHHLPALPLSSCLCWSPCFCLPYKFNLRFPVCWASLHICQQRPADKMMGVRDVRATKNPMLKTSGKSHHLGSKLGPPENFATTGISQPFCSQYRFRT